MDFTLLQSRMRQFVDDGKYPGIVTLIWRAGEVVFCDAVGWSDLSRRSPVQRDTIFRLASMSKPITSTAALILVEEGRLDLADPVARWLPEADNIAVLRTPTSQIEDVVRVERPPTLFDLMTHTAGFAWSKGLDLPITRAMYEATGLTPFVPYDPDTLVRRVCRLPLIQQPGTGWNYGVSTDLLGVIVARASGSSLPDFLQERIFDPLRMTDTSFFVPPEKIDRLSVGYVRDDDGELVLHDDARTGFWTRTPVFPSGGGGLVATVDDYLAFAKMLLSKGRVGAQRILSEDSIELMTSSQLHAAQTRTLDPSVDFLLGQGFGLGVSVTLANRSNRRSAGSFSWPGGYGTTWFADRRENLVALWMTQLWLDNQVESGPAFEEGVYAAVRGETLR